MRVYRRQWLSTGTRAGVGLLGSGAVLGGWVAGTEPVAGLLGRERVQMLDVRFWLSEAAGRYAGAPEKIRSCLTRVLNLDHWDVSVEYGGIVSVSTEDGARVTSRGEWPARVMAGVAGLGRLQPARDVNLLVTDGQMREAPTGYGIPHIASVGGASHLSSLQPIESVTEPLAHSTPVRTMQVLVHEVGHALSLRHDHGQSYRVGDAVVATPMVSTYAWTDEYAGGRCECGTVRPVPAGEKRILDLSFSGCARSELERYRRFSVF